MLTSKAHLLTTTLFALFSFYAIFYSLYQCQLKFNNTSSLNLLSQDNSTWFQPKVKVVMVIIDGFRFDYLLNYENLDHDPYLQLNKLNKFNQAYFENPDRFVVVKALADQPTMTVMRVPCLMTGNVPRLGSVLTAFGALPAIEDSVPRQLYLQGKKSYFSGDPILHEYFPKYLESDFELGAFNLRDKRADAPSQAYISEKIAENKFDFLAAHFLRLDHAGHHQNLYWQGVRDAIDDIDQYLIHIMENIDDNTMLIFGGDHGQVKQGGHGGGTPQETNTAIVAYYKKGFMKNRYKNLDLEKIMRSINETDDLVHQIDLAPTLSMLMGLPTPFSNMGQILNDLYPVGDYLTPQENCPDVAFLIQMLHDNHLNSLQVWNYFKKYHEGQSLFKHKEYARIAKLFEKVQARYKAAQTMIDQSQQCEDSFCEIAMKAIKKSQKLSNEIHDLVITKTPHDLVIFWQGFLILVLACASYILQIQYIYDTKDYEYMSLLTWTKPKNWKAILKTLIPLLIVLTLIWTCMLSNSPRIMRPITSSVLFLALYVVGFSIVSFLSKHYPEATSPTTSASEETQRLSLSLKEFFIFQNPLVAGGAAVLIGFLFYLTHVFRLHYGHMEKLASYDPYICVMLIACRISGRYMKISRYIFAIAAVLCVTLRLVDIYDYWFAEVNMVMGFVFLGDWLWGESQFSIHKLKAGRIWSYQYIAGFIVLIFYHLILPSRSDLVQITLPRVIWFITIGSCLASFALKMPRKTIKRNMQVNLVLFLCLMQMHRKFVYFTIVLSIYRIITYLFKRAQFKNYLYALILGFISYIGLLYIGFGDRNLPRDFGPAFVGLRDFHIGLCLLLYGSAMLSTIILGMLFMSFYSQNLELQEVELGTQKEEESDGQVVALKGHSKIIRKRNIIMYCFFYNVLMIGAAINPIILRNPKKIGLSMERFLADGIFYLFTINILYFVF